MLPDSLQNVLEEPCAPSRVRAIVLDDDPIWRSLQARLLALLGHETRTPVHPDEAPRLALADAADLMLLGIGMPGRDGSDVLREREAAFGRAPLPVIAVTGYASAQDRARAEQTMRRAIESNGQFDSEFRIAWPDGETRHIASRDWRSAAPTETCGG